MTSRVSGVALALVLALGACSTTAATPSFTQTPTTAVSSTLDAAAATTGIPTDLLNPQVTEATIATTICVSGWTATVRPPASYTSPLKRHQIISYSYADTRPASYEGDHVIALSVGGAPRNPANLYPEPIVQSHADDVVEVATQHAICSGRMTLAEGRAKLYAVKTAHGYDRTKSVA